MSHGYETDADVVLDVSNLNVAFRHDKQLTQAVRNLSFTLKRGETLAIRSPPCRYCACWNNPAAR